MSKVTYEDAEGRQYTVTLPGRIVGTVTPIGTLDDRAKELNVSLERELVEARKTIAAQHVRHAALTEELCSQCHELAQKLNTETERGSGGSKERPEMTYTTKETP